MKYFDVIIFIKAKKKLRLKRFKLKKGDKKLFNLLIKN
jgi:dephospho-CoA kinase